MIKRLQIPGIEQKVAEIAAKLIDANKDLDEELLKLHRLAMEAVLELRALELRIKMMRTQK
jgi:hypothetical protein